MADTMDEVLARMRAKVNGAREGKAEMHLTTGQGPGQSQTGSSSATAGEQIVELPESPSTLTTAALQWLEPERRSDHLYIRYSTCRGYSIHATREKTGWVYTAYVRTDIWNNMLMPARVGKEMALELAEKHARARD